MPTDIFTIAVSRCHFLHCSCSNFLIGCLYPCTMHYYFFFLLLKLPSNFHCEYTGVGATFNLLFIGDKSHNPKGSPFISHAIKRHLTELYHN